jgi:vacuolar-type H+-ATPase subunit H
MSDPQPATGPDTAAAMERVLQAEREATAAIAECERAGTEAVERAREQRRAILERAQARIVALHARAAQALERRGEEILQKHLRSSTAEVEQLADPARRQAALGRLAARLSTGTDDGH